MSAIANPNLAAVDVEPVVDFSDRLAARRAPGKIAVVTAPSEQDHRAAAIRQQLAHMLESRVFVQSEKLSRFLRFVVEHVLDGNRDYLKEYVIGSEVYDRKPPYHPSQDSIVRTEARRLRSKLKEYYETEGKEDPVYVYLRAGSYVPVFQYKKALVGVAPGARKAAILIAILPFHDISQSPLSSRYARGIPDELAYALMRAEGCRVIARTSAPQMLFEGSVREESSRIRVTARIVDVDGFHLWTTRVDAQIDSGTVCAMEEQIASALCLGISVIARDSSRRIG